MNREKDTAQLNAPHKNTIEQSSTLLCRLPSELRLKIYQHVFEGSVFQLIRKPNVHIDRAPMGRLIQQRMPPRIILGDHPLLPRKQPSPKPMNELLNHTALEICRERRSRWGLLLTCRQIYHEATQTFYNTSTLRFSDPHVLLNMATVYLHKQHLLAIRRLEIVWFCFLRHSDTHGLSLQEHSQLAWDEVWHLIADEMKLSSLQVCSLIFGRTQDLTLEAPWIQSLAHVQGIPQCEITFKPCGAKLHPLDEQDRRILLERLSRTLQENMSSGGNCSVLVDDPDANRLEELAR
ncbi:MAG: hypothetical protein Q9218_007410 [Villophora microphyllina]